MKERIVETARLLMRAAPLPLRTKKRLQNFCFTHLSSLFQHLPAYRMWSLQHPDSMIKGLSAKDIIEIRSKALTKAEYQVQKPGILMVSHSLGGGTESHLQQLGEKLTEEGVQLWALRSLGRDRLRLLPLLNPTDKFGLIYHLEDETEALIEQLKALQIQLIHVHHFLDFPPNFYQKIQKIADALRVPYDFTVHDYYTICPRFTLYDDIIRGYCGEPDVKRCSGCVKTFGSAVGKEVDVEQWRTDYAGFLTQARQVYTPDLDVKERLTRYVPEANIINHPHWDDQPIQSIARSPEKKAHLKVAVLGALAPHKGSMVLKECGEDAKERNLPIDYTLIGFSDIDWQLKKYITVTGEYKAEELPELLKQGGYDIVFFPAVLPETFSYTLSEALAYGLYPVSFNIGAIGRRIAELGYGSVLPYKHYRDATKINDALLSLVIPDEAPKDTIKSAQSQYRSILNEYYNFEISSST